MLDIIYVLLFIFAVIMMFYSIMGRIPYVAIMDSVVWLVLALFTIGGIEVNTMKYNSTTGVYDPYVQTISSNSMGELSYLWMLLGVIMMIFFVTFMLETMYKGPKEL